MAKNNQAINYLKGQGWTEGNAKKIVTDLIDGGFIEADPMTEPERMAEAARNWCTRLSRSTPHHIFDCASGWTTSSWEVVLDEPFEESNPMMMKDIFKALLILAKDAKVDLYGS